jgi:hypothetical protein
MPHAHGAGTEVAYSARLRLGIWLILKPIRL